MQYVLIQIVGAFLITIGGQGVIRLIINPTDVGLIGLYVAEEPQATLWIYAALALVGSATSFWGYRLTAAATKQ